MKKKGYQIVESDEVADIYVINTCTVTNLGIGNLDNLYEELKDPTRIQSLL